VINCLPADTDCFRTRSLRLFAAALKNVPFSSLQLYYWSLYDRLQQTFLRRRRLRHLGRIICPKEPTCLCTRHRLSTPSTVNTATLQHVDIVCPTSKKCLAKSHWYALLLCSAIVIPNADVAQAEKDQYIHALRTHQINTVVELRRIEKAFAVLGTPDVSEPMTAACKRTRQVGLSLKVTDLCGRVLLCRFARAADRTSWPHKELSVQV
jgi:hypothetical protein